MIPFRNLSRFPVAGLSRPLRGVPEISDPLPSIPGIFCGRAAAANPTSEKSVPPRLCLQPLRFCLVHLFVHTLRHMCVGCLLWNTRGQPPMYLYWHGGKKSDPEAATQQLGISWKPSLGSSTTESPHSKRSRLISAQRNTGLQRLSGMNLTLFSIIRYYSPLFNFFNFFIFVCLISLKCNFLKFN